MQEPVSRPSKPSFHLFVGARPESFAYGKGMDTVLLLQPDPAVADKLERAAEGQSGVRVVAASIGRTTASAVLNLMNLASLSSLRQPSAVLQDLLPGLKIVASRDVRVLPVTALNIPVELKGVPYSVHIQIDMPGSEFDILSCLDEDGLLAKTTECVIRCGADVFFDGGRDFQAVIDLLTGKGFVQTDRDDSDPDWPVLRFLGNPETTQAVLARIASLEGMVQAARAEAEAAQKVTADRDAALAALKTENVSQAARVSELEAERAVSRETISGLEQAAEERKKRIGFLEVENKRVVDLQADIGFQVRMNALLRSDFDELSGRFEQCERQRLRLEELLRRLTPKLQLAAEELHQLQDSSLPKAKAVEVSSGKAKTTRGKRERNA